MMSAYSDVNIGNMIETGLCLIYITSFALNVPRDYVHFIRHHSLFNTSSKFDFENDIPKRYDQEYDKNNIFCRY